MSHLARPIPYWVRITFFYSRKRTRKGGTVTLNGFEPFIVFPSVMTTTKLAASGLSPFFGV